MLKIQFGIVALLGLLVACSCLQQEKHTVDHTGQVVDNPFYDQAFIYLNKDRLDSAFLNFDFAKTLFEENNDTFGAGKCLLHMAILLNKAGDYYGAQETSLDVLKYFDSTNLQHKHYLTSNYNNLGIAAFQLKNHAMALDFYRKSLDLTTDSLEISITKINIAKLYEEQGDFEDAIALYEEVLQNTNSDEINARAINNLAVAKWLQNPEADVQDELEKAFSIRKKNQDYWGITSSLYHLSKFNSKTNPLKAQEFAKQMLEETQRLNIPHDQILALELLIELMPTAKNYFGDYKRLSDSLQLDRNSSKNQFAVIRYEVEKNKAANLELLHQNERKSQQLFLERSVAGVVFLLVISLVVFVLVGQKRRKQRIVLEAQNRIKAHQLQTSRKIHDVVANGIYRIMATIENRSDLDRDNFLDLLETIYEKSRDLSYQAQDQEDEDALDNREKSPEITYNDVVTQLITSFSSDHVKILIAGNSASLWSSVSEEIRRQLLPILQELMVNMKKHSQAKRVVIKFYISENQLVVVYLDDGVGFPENYKFGNGLQNTGNRIKTLNGTLTFVQSTMHSVQINVQFPIHT